jgi:CheY-like chemotaxis protein
VIVAGNGLEVLAAIERFSFDHVLLDVHVPEMDGFETTRALREKEKDGMSSSDHCHDGGCHEG